MRTVRHQQPLQDELTLAIGLVWGYLNIGKFEEADQLVQGCLQVWPSDTRLMLMAVFATVELGRPLTSDARLLLEQTNCIDGLNVILRRANELAETDNAVQR